MANIWSESAPSLNHIVMKRWDRTSISWVQKQNQAGVCISKRQKVWADIIAKRWYKFIAHVSEKKKK